MADNAKAKSAKERLEAAKRSAEEAELVDLKGEETPVEPAESKAPDADAASETDASAEQGVEAEAAETTDASDGETPNETNGDTAQSDGEASEITDAPENPDAENPDAENPEAETAETEAAETETAEEADAPSDEPSREETAQQPAEAEETSGSLAATILKFLVILFVGGALALWAGPRIAPNLPGWAAPVASFLTPGTNEAAERIDAVAEEGAQQRAALATEVEAAKSAAAAADAKAADASAAVQQARADLSAEIADVAEEPRADLERMNDLATRLVAAEATVEGLRAEIDALGNVTTEDAAPSAEVLERVAAFGAAVEGLRAEIASLKSRTAEIEALAKSEDLAALTERVAALEESEAATAAAQGEATDIRRTANIGAAMTRIEQSLLSGAPFAAALSDATSLSGESAPAALSDAAASGLPTQETLLGAFPTAAQAGYAAALEENAGDSFTGGVLAKLQGRLGGRPSVETEGDDAGAVLSRIEARLKEGRLSDALAEAEGLSDAARAAMSGWLGDLRRASDGAAAFTAWRDAVTAN